MTTTVRELWRYPVKSMGGERVERLAMTAIGVEGDRLFAIQQKQDERLLTARLEPRMLGARARLVDGVAHIRLPDGRTITSDSRDVDLVLSKWLGRELKLIRARRDRADATHLIPVSEEVAAFMLKNPSRSGVFKRATVGRDRELGPVLEWRSPGSGFSDGGTVHILSERLLARLRATTDAKGWSVRRFRPNLVLDIQRGEPDEDAWVGRRLRVGAVTLSATEQCIRCVLATRAQPGLADEPRILTALRPRQARLGIYADVEAPGEAAVGDRVGVAG